MFSDLTHGFDAVDTARKCDRRECQARAVDRRVWCRGARCRQRAAHNHHRRTQNLEQSITPATTPSLLVAEKLNDARPRHASVPVVGVIAHADSVMANATASSLSRGHRCQPGRSLPSNRLGRTSFQELAVMRDARETAAKRQYAAQQRQPHWLAHASA